MILSSAASEEPIPFTTDSPSSLVAQNTIAIGYGQRPDGSSGTKYRTLAHVTAVQGGYIFVDPAVCPGDSGGPTFYQGQVVTVTSYGYTQNCRYLDGMQRVDIQGVQDWLATFGVTAG